MELKLILFTFKYPLKIHLLTLPHSKDFPPLGAF